MWLKNDKRNEIREKIQEIKGNFNKEIEILKKNQQEILKVKVLIDQIKNFMKSIISRLDHTETRFSVLEHKVYNLRNMMTTENMC